jgi:hypothetical protein
MMSIERRTDCAKVGILFGLHFGTLSMWVTFLLLRAANFHLGVSVVLFCILLFAALSAAFPAMAWRLARLLNYYPFRPPLPPVRPDNPDRHLQPENGVGEIGRDE